MADSGLADETTRPATAELPLLPVAITTLMSTDFLDADAFGDLLELASLEPCLAIRLLQIDAAQGSLRKSETLSKALMHIGAKGLEPLVRGQSTARVFTPVTAAEKILWLHSIQVAILARDLAAEYRKLRIDPDQAYLAGLLHDIGRFVHYDKVAEGPNEIDAKGYNSPMDLLNAEAVVFGVNHVQEGKHLCRHLALPAYVEDTVFHHHDSIDSLGHLSADVRRIIELVQLADGLSVVALRHASAADLGDCCRDFVNGRSLHLKGLKPKTYTLQTLATGSIRRANEAFRSLKLGPAP